MTALASNHPDSTIAVRAAYYKSQKQNHKHIIKNRYLGVINQLGGFADMKNCYFYFAGNASKINNGQTLGNYYDIENICTDIVFRLQYPAALITFMSDSHVSVFLSLYKSSKNFRNYSSI